MTVLACIDRSEFAGSVCDHAAWSAQRSGDESVEVLHAIGRNTNPSGYSDHSGRLGVDTSTTLLEEITAIDAQWNRLATQAGRELLADAAQRLREAGVTHVTQRLLQGELVDHLPEHEARASLVVVGKQGETAHQAKAHLGRNLERVIRASYRPVLVAPHQFRPIERFVFAWDGGKSSGHAIGFLVETGLLQGIEGHLLFVGKGTEPEKERLDDALRHLQSAGHDISPSIRSGRASEAISGMVNEVNADLLVMGAYGHSHIRNLIIGSTTTEVLQTSQVATLVCR
jgi:nucleotide-binding universal stress UspA family protein